MMSANDKFGTLVIPTMGPWQKKEARVAVRNFGKGSKHPFSWYFQGASNVHVKSVKEICGWLSKCKYVADEVLFQEEDFWQHPVTFESTRKGDCEDHALWAWRKLTELGIQAEFVAGKMESDEEGDNSLIGHAWVMFKKKNFSSWKVLEAAGKDRKKMIYTEKEAGEKYVPEYSVDGEYKTYRFVQKA